MRFGNAAWAAMLLTVSTLTWAGSSNNYVVPTTTLTAQTSNNTSAANSFTSQSNGNLGASNISKVDVHSLLYSGNNTKVYAHMMVWFGQSGHMNVGYSSNNPTQVANQLNDMISRGIQGVIIDWYGPGSYEDGVTKLVMAAAEQHPGFTFAIMVDQGAIEWDSCGGCTPQQALIAQLQYIEQTYFASPAYMTVDGAPMVTNFGVATTYNIDWNAVSAALSTKPDFFFMDDEGYTTSMSGGSYSWVKPTTNDYGVSYLTNFYQTGMSFPQEETVGASYKGFNDTLASWSEDRIMGQQCGGTWLNTFSLINSLYNSGKQLPALQLVTWNDYEEGTEIESGIDNCVVISSSVSGNTLQWKVNGDNELDHYVAYISLDGENLMPLTDVQPGISSLNLCGFPIPNGNYTLFVQAVGKPSMLNHITGALNYAATCNNVPPPPPTLSFTASPTSLTIPAGQSGTLQVVAQAQSGSFNNAIALLCSGLPSSLSCSFSPATIIPGSGAATSTLTISAQTVTSSSLPVSNGNPVAAFWLLPFGLAGLVFAGSARRRYAQMLAVIAVLSLGMAVSSCGGNGSGSNAAAVNSVSKTGAYTVTINGNSGSTSLSTSVNIVLQ
jgi:hypothetical protein